MNFLLFALPLLALSSAHRTPIGPVTDASFCKCPEEFAVRPYGDKGEYRCFGNILRIILPCNLPPRRPRCSCTEATGVLTDHTGTWCTQYGGGREVRRWNCENVEQWEAFFKEYPDQKFQEVSL